IFLNVCYIATAIFRPKTPIPNPIALIIDGFTLVFRPKTRVHPTTPAIATRFFPQKRRCHQPLAVT
ncbi:MAG: hypothetical protein ACYSR5_11670, partial [Planctomycetota bacterium]